MTNINHLVKEERDLTQEKVAKLRQNYSIWETNTKFIPLKHLNNYCNVFNVSMGV
jgi:transcriptional regulator with XRE-family HTH domain